MEVKSDRQPPKSLAQYLNCADYNGLMKNRGKGIRKWKMVENKEWTFQPDFMEKLDNKVSKWFDRCLLARAASLKDKQEEEKEPQDPLQYIWVKGNRYRYDPEGKKEEEVPPAVQVKIEKIAEEDVVDHRQDKQRSLTFMRDVCVGTDDYWAPKVSSRPPTQVPSLLAPLPQQSTPYVPPHLKQQQLVAQSSSSSAYQKEVGGDSRIDKKEYEKAKSWTPKTEEQRNALEQAKLDIFNILVVGKGCALKYLIREFYRVTEENLDLSKIGVPDLRTLLVQMADMVYFRRERYTGNIFIFPNLANNQFEMVAHIGELVAEQRKDQNFRIPDETLLYEFDITELFHLPEWRQQQRPVQQSTYHGSYVNPNYNYNDYSNYYQNFYDRARASGGPQVDYNLYAQAVRQQLTQQYYASYGYHQMGNSYYR